MDLDNINDIDILREAAKQGRVKLKDDVKSNDGKYTFQKGFWYLMTQDEDYVYIFSEGYKHIRYLNYKEADKYLSRQY